LSRRTTPHPVLRADLSPLARGVLCDTFSKAISLATEGRISLRATQSIAHDRMSLANRDRYENIGAV
jgi:hypothetical protein